MKTQSIMGIVLIVAGVLGFAYGGFSFTRETHKAELGSLQLSVDERQAVNIPAWASIGAILTGGLLLVVRRKS
jgi:hypothetical protein